jgi:aldehyde:ferredoxin oxidoreductase
MRGLLDLVVLQFLRAQPMHGYQIITSLRKQFGSEVGIICIGPAGEMKMAGAGIAVSDVNDIQVRYAARGGLGAVMGSKGIKAIVVDEIFDIATHTQIFRRNRFWIT